MSKKPRRRAPSVGTRHGAAVEAPSEYGFVASDTPDPGEVESDADGVAGARGPVHVVWTALKLTAGMIIVVGISLAIAWGARRFALTTPRFAIAAFDIEGNRRLSNDEIVRRAELEKGTNIFQADLESAEARLLQDPWVESVKITRELPSTVRIVLAQREVRALALIDGALFLLTPSGEPFKQVAESDPHDLPVVTGLLARSFAVDKIRETERARAALDVLRQYETLPISAVYPPQELHLADDGSSVMTIGKKDPITLELGRHSWRQKLTMVGRVLGRVTSHGQKPAIIFLDNEAHEERVVVRMR